MTGNSTLVSHNSTGYSHNSGHRRAGHVCYQNVARLDFMQIWNTANNTYRSGYIARTGNCSLQLTFLFFFVGLLEKLYNTFSFTSHYTTNVIMLQNIYRQF